MWKNGTHFFSLRVLQLSLFEDITLPVGPTILFSLSLPFSTGFLIVYFIYK